MVICFECSEEIKEENLIRVVWLNEGIPVLHEKCLAAWQSRGEVHKNAYQGLWPTKRCDDGSYNAINASYSVSKLAVKE